MLDKLVFFLIKKRVQTAVGTMDQVSKTKIFMLIEGVLRLIEFVSPYFNRPILFNPSLHGVVYSLAVVAFRDSQNAPEAIKAAK